MNVSRRNFLKLSVGSAAIAGSPAAYAKAAESVVIPKRKFGRHDDMLSVIGIGGHTLYMAGSQKEASDIAARAVDLGVNVFDNAWDYHDGAAEEYMGVALKGKRDKVFLWTKFCNYHIGPAAKVYTPDVKGAMTMLEDSLRRLKTDHLDLWMMHQVSHDDVKDTYREQGAIEAIELAKKQGKIRYAGFTGHTDPKVHRGMIEGGYEWDALLMPVSAVGAMGARGFEQEIFPLAEEKNIAVLGMKGFGGSRRNKLHDKATAESVLKYALSYKQLCTHLIGIDKMEYLDQAVAASVTTPYTLEQREIHASKFDFAPGTDGYAAQYHGEKLYEAGSCCLRRDKENA